MSIHHYANSADVIDEGGIRRFCELEWQSFMTAIRDSGEEWDSIAKTLSVGDNAKYQPINKAYRNLLIAFKEKNLLDIRLGYHYEEEEGDVRRGPYWMIHGMYRLSPAGRRMRRFVDHQVWVTYG